MKIEFKSATGCPFGQFVVSAENEQDSAILETFLQPQYNWKKWKFWRNGETYSNGHVRGFNFGWIEIKSKKFSLLTKIKRKFSA